MKKYPFDLARLVRICREHGVKKIGVLGSYARGEATDESDIDILVEFSTPVSLLMMVRLNDQLTEAMGRKVDLVTPSGLSPHIKDHVLADVDYVYEG